MRNCDSDLYCQNCISPLVSKWTERVRPACRKMGRNLQKERDRFHTSKRLCQCSARGHISPLAPHHLLQNNTDGTPLKPQRQSADNNIRQRYKMCILFTFLVECLREGGVKEGSSWWMQTWRFTWGWMRERVRPEKVVSLPTFLRHNPRYK